MKNWICYNLFGENPDSVDMFGMISGLSMLGFLVSCAIYLFIYVTFFVVG